MHRNVLKIFNFQLMPELPGQCIYELQSLANRCFQLNLRTGLKICILNFSSKCGTKKKFELTNFFGKMASRCPNKKEFSILNHVSM